MPQQWYYERNGKTRGPVSREELQQLIGSGELSGNSQVIRDGMSQWVPASSINSTDDTASPPPVRPSVQKPSPPNKPPRPAPPSYQRPPNRPQRRPNLLPLYFGSLAVVAILAALLGWMAHSLSSPNDENEKSEQTAKADAKPNAAEGSKPRVSSVETKRSSDESTELLRAEQESQRSAQAGLESQAERSQVTVNNGAVSSSQRSTTGSDETSVLKEPLVASNADAEPITKPRQQDAITSPPAKTETNLEQAAGKPNNSKQQEPVALFQELDIQRQPKLSMLGAVQAQDIQYRILSELMVGQPDEKGFREVQQVVKDTQLVKADALSQAMFAESLKRLIGWQFSYTLNSRNVVIEIRGPGDGKKIAPVKPPGAQGFLVTSVMDEDGWKELAELSFFTPDPKGMRNQSWKRQMTHNFEPLGSWFGETTFVPRGQERGLMRIDYAHKLTYKPPARGAPAAGGLPFKINNADLKAGTAGGIIYFDTEQERVHSAQEQFHVRGSITADALGQALTIPIEEKQAITVRIVDQNPWDNRAE